MRERVAKLLPEPGIVVFDVGVGLDVVIYGDTHLRLKFVEEFKTGTTVKTACCDHFGQDEAFVITLTDDFHLVTETFEKWS